MEHPQTSQADAADDNSQQRHRDEQCSHSIEIWCGK